MKYLFSDNVKEIFLLQLFEIYNTKFCLARLEHFKGPYEKNEPYVVHSRYKWTNGVYVSVYNKMYYVTGAHILTQP